MDERIYKYTDIVSITRNEILFNDGRLINLVECTARWAKAKGIAMRNYTCIGDRDSSGKEPCFILYSKPVTKVVFTKKGLFGNKRCIKEYEMMRARIGSLGWTLRDTSGR